MTYAVFLKLHYITNISHANRSQAAVDGGAAERARVEPQSGAQSGLPGPRRAQARHAMGEARLGLFLGWLAAKPTSYERRCVQGAGQESISLA